MAGHRDGSAAWNSDGCRQPAPWRHLRADRNRRARSFGSLLLTAECFGEQFRFLIKVFCMAHPSRPLVLSLAVGVIIRQFPFPSSRDVKRRVRQDDSDCIYITSAGLAAS